MTSTAHFRYRTDVHLSATDATGVLYFPEQFSMAIQAFEAFLKSKGLPLSMLLEVGAFLLPVVHAESDYFAPLKVGDELEIHMNIVHIGVSSFTTHYCVVDLARDKEVGEVSLVHVSVSKETRGSIPLPQELLDILPKPVPESSDEAP